MPTKNAAAANCGFVLHLFVLILGGLYVLWIANALVIIEGMDSFDPVTFHQQGVAYVVIVFFSTIVVYFVLNASSVPSIHSRDTLWDDYSQPGPPQVLQQQSNTLPTICDIDVAVINDMVWAFRKQQ